MHNLCSISDMADFEISETYVSDDPENLTDFLGTEIADRRKRKISR